MVCSSHGTRAQWLTLCKYYSPPVEIGQGAKRISAEPFEEWPLFEKETGKADSLFAFKLVDGGSSRVRRAFLLPGYPHDNFIETRPTLQRAGAGLGQGRFAALGPVQMAFSSPPSRTIHNRSGN